MASNQGALAQSNPSPKVLSGAAIYQWHEASGTSTEHFDQSSAHWGTCTHSTVDNNNDIIYYSDEGFGVRAYPANPSEGDEEITNFGKNFVGDQEGISIVKKDKNYVVVSDQQKINQFRIFTPSSKYEEVGSFYVNCIDSDGSEFHPGPFPEPFENGIFVAMSDDLSFHYYSWDQLSKYFED